eukprot:353989-Rhodomonas_salina.3
MARLGSSGTWQMGGQLWRLAAYEAVGTTGQYKRARVTVLALVRRNDIAALIVPRRGDFVFDSD